MTSPTPPLRVAIYARQSVEEPQGIVQQIEDCREQARRHGWVVVEVYPDDDTSGSKTRGSKTQWRKMLSDFDAQHFDAVLANSVDRLTRSMSDVLELRPPKRDVRVITARGGIDTVDDDTALKLLVVLAEREVREKVIRSQRYALERRKLGHPPAGRTPYGYRWVRKYDRNERGARFKIDEDEAAVVRSIYSEFLAGAALGEIARSLNDEGRRTRDKARWQSPTIRRILLNPHYAALLPPTQPTGQNDLAKVAIEDCINGVWDPIVNLDQLLAARGKLVGVKPRHNGTARKWLLSGLAVCGICQGPVRSARASTHPTARLDGSGTAPARYHSVYRCIEGHFVRKGAMIDEFVKEACIERLSRPDASDLLASRKDGPDLAVLLSRRTELESRDATIASLIATGKMRPSSAEEALDELSKELRTVNDEIAWAVRSDPLADPLGSGNARAWWDDATTTLARRRSVVETLMSVVIHPVGNGKRITTLSAAADTIEINWKRPV